MNKKVLIISSSPRKGGNSEIVEGVNDVGDIDGHPALERAYQVGKNI